MQSAKLLISLPQDLHNRLQTLIPARQRSALIRELLRKEIEKREKALFECAKAIEKDEKLNKEMQDWDSTSGDGLAKHQYSCALPQQKSC